MKYYVILCFTIWLAGCNQTNRQYYWQNPGKIKQALSACPTQSPVGLSCKELTVITAKFRYLANELKKNPQLFGLHIITQQEKIAKMEQILSKTNDPQLAKELKQDKSSLAEYLAVVGYYESPQGAKNEDFGQ